MDREILAVKTRKDLYDFVRKNPGFHLRELSRALNLSITLADYHLRFLEKHELITSAMDAEYKRFFPRSTPGQGRVPPLSDLRGSGGVPARPTRRTPGPSGWMHSAGPSRCRSPRWWRRLGGSARPSPRAC